LTDGQGRTVDFRNTVIVMTSNLGSELIQRLTQEGRSSEMKAAVMEVVGQHFRPEFINRLDESVVFQPLGMEQIRSIARIQLLELSERLKEREMSLEVSEAALDKLVEAGFDPVYGARPLKRAIQQQLENGLAEKILAGVFGKGDRIRVGLEAEGLTYLSAD